VRGGKYDMAKKEAEAIKEGVKGKCGEKEKKKKGP